ncbi:uncharacterized protein LOC143225826 [Tachypleus tridentatus]|uniref:uncharacterized protein LOC143225826 n=1 Tax=Tachypleus tridentatus TaxID=6853 RepID=UPI003FD50CFE
MVITKLGTAAFSSLEDHKQISVSANKIIDGVEELFDATVSSSENHLFVESDSMKKEFDREIYKSNKDKKNNQIVEVDEFEKANRTSNRFPIECKGQNSSFLYHYNVKHKSKTHSTYEKFISKDFTSLKRSKTEDDISNLKEWKVANTQKSQSDDDVSLGIKQAFDDHKHDELLLPFDTRERGPDFKTKPYAFSDIVADTLCSRNIEHNNVQEILVNNLESLINKPLTMRPYFKNVNKDDNNVSLRKVAHTDSMKSLELEPIEVSFDAVSPLEEDESKISHTCKQNVIGNVNKSVADRSRVIKRTWQKAMSKKTSYLDDKVNFSGSLKDDFINGKNYPYSKIITHQHNSAFNEALLLNNRRCCSSEINISGRNANVETNEVRITERRSLCNLNQLSNSETVSEYSGSSSTALSENQYNSVHLMRKMEKCAYQTRPPQRCELNNDSENEVPSGQDFVFQDTNIKPTTRPYRSFTWMNENNSNKCEELLHRLTRVFQRKVYLRFLPQVYLKYCRMYPVLRLLKVLMFIEMTNQNSLLIISKLMTLTTLVTVVFLFRNAPSSRNMEVIECIVQRNKIL